MSPKFYYCPLPFSHLLTGFEHAHRTSWNPYKAQFFSSSSDLMKSTVADESLSATTTRVLVQRETTYLLQDTTEWEIYTDFIVIFSELFKFFFLHFDKES